MALTFVIGDASAPKGHALVYFRSGTDVLATYVVVLPVAMDMGKYLPPLLASQLSGMAGGMLGEGMGSFAAPPVPEKVGSVDFVQRLALLRGDDLIEGGSINSGDITAAMAEAAEVVQQYHRLYEQHAGVVDNLPEGDLRGVQAPIETQGAVRVEHVLYELMNDRDKLGELSKLVSTMRFATERADLDLIGETDSSMAALERLLPEHYWAGQVRSIAKDTSDKGGQLAQLYVERCYKLLDEDFPAVEEIEKRISDF